MDRTTTLALLTINCLVLGYIAGYFYYNRQQTQAAIAPPPGAPRPTPTGLPTRNQPARSLVVRGASGQSHQAQWDRFLAS